MGMFTLDEGELSFSLRRRQVDANPFHYRVDDVPAFLFSTMSFSLNLKQTRLERVDC